MALLRLAAPYCTPSPVAAAAIPPHNCSSWPCCSPTAPHHHQYRFPALALRARSTEPTADLTSSSASDAPPSPVSTFTSVVPGTHLKFWTTHEGIQPSSNLGKGWLDEHAVENPMLVANLLLIASMAKDRAEMHSIMGQQRDNWNKLFQSTLTACIMTATVLSALDAQYKNISMSLPAFVIDAAVVASMSWINRFQPSQLAEEQRGACRMFRRLADDIEYTLQISPALRQEASTYLEECRNRMFLLDKSFPLPLTPNGLEKFPKEVAYPILSQRADDTAPKIKVSSPENGWSHEIAEDLLNTADLLRKSDMRIYKDWARDKLRLNRFLAIGAPLFASLGAGLNLLDAFGNTNLGLFAALSGVLAAFAGAISHDMQVGMIFELFRFCAGYFADIDARIQREVRIPVEKREDGSLFHQRIAYQLGREGGQVPLVPDGSETAGILF